MMRHRLVKAFSRSCPLPYCRNQRCMHRYRRSSFVSPYRRCLRTYRSKYRRCCRHRARYWHSLRSYRDRGGSEHTHRLYRYSRHRSSRGPRAGRRRSNRHRSPCSRCYHCTATCWEYIRSRSPYCMSRSCIRCCHCKQWA
jgi:hypothetical protein